MWFGLPTHLAHPLKDERAVAVHALGPPLQGCGENRGEPSRLLAAHISGGGSVVIPRRRLGAINPGTPLHHVEVNLQNPLLAEDEFGHRHQGGFGTLAKDRSPGSKEEVFYELLRNGGRSAGTTSIEIVFGSDLDFVPVEPMVLVEARVLSGDYGVLEAGGDLAERNEFVSFAIRLSMNPGLHAALNMDRRGWRVDPPPEQKDERGKRPDKGDAKAKPSGNRSEGNAPDQGFEGWIWPCLHTSGY